MLTTLLFAAAPLAAQAPAALDQAPQEKRGLVKHTDAASPGYTLVAPLRSTSTYLIDLAGVVAHEWKSDAPPGQAVYLLGNGDLLRTERVDNPVFHGGGQGGRIRQITPAGEVVWEYVGSDENRCLHHDVAVMPNGHVLAVAWEQRTREQALAAGRDPELVDEGGLWPDAVLEIEPIRPSGGKVVWEWHAFDHLVQDRDERLANHGDVAQSLGRIDINASGIAEAGGPGPEELERLRRIGYAGEAPPRRDRGGPGGRSDWLHTNAIDYRADLDLIVLSVHNLSELWVIDHSTTSAEAATSQGGRWGRGGDLLARWGNPRVHGHGTAADQRLFVQHDVQWIPAGLPGAGHLLVFNNGDRDRHPSSVDEIDLPLDAERLKQGLDARALAGAKVVWTYTSPLISSGHISGAQRQPNGNTLICAGETGRLVEVSAAGEVVWDFLNDKGGDVGGPPRGDGPGDGGPRGRPRDGGGPPDRRGPGGPGGPGPMSPFGVFRVDRYAPDHPGVRVLGLAAPATGESPR